MAFNPISISVNAIKGLNLINQALSIREWRKRLAINTNIKQKNQQSNNNNLGKKWKKKIKQTIRQFIPINAASDAQYGI